MLPKLKFLFSIFVLIFGFVSIKTGGVENPIAKPSCQVSCGGVSIPYPFGIGENCYKSRWFEITCNNDPNNTSFPILSAYQLKISKISFHQLHILQNWKFQSCYPRDSGMEKQIRPHNQTGFNPFLFSHTTNKMVGFGCDIFASLSSNNDPNKTLYTDGCISICQNTTGLGKHVLRRNCLGIDCCHANVPKGLKSIHLRIMNINGTGSRNSTYCSSALIAEQDFYNFSANHEVPMRMSWVIDNKTCEHELKSSRFCGDNAHCIPYPGGHRCSCNKGFTGNPYLSSGCIDIDECQKGTFKCGHNAFCNNTPGSYHCYCQPGYVLQPNGSCTVDTSKNPRSSMTQMVTLGLAVALSVAVAMGGTILCTWKLKREKEVQLRKMFFKRNGGLLLRQQVSSQQDAVVKTQILGLHELERATDHFNERRMCGKGGFGAVYKGMLDDGRIVAIKRSHIVHEKQVAQFINEVVILSRINHRNIVKLLGCCLETEVPLLVYEFIGNGNLSQHLCDKDSVLSISWDSRVRVALEIADALAYMHSAASTPIFHRDVKSSNILVDDNYNAKISDFGISRSIPNEKTHLTTVLQGTFGYLDPEYFHSGQFTEKSDVYSFGVVLVELLTGERAVSKTKAEVEEKSLVLNFTLAMKEGRLFDVLQPCVRHQGRKQEIMEFAKLAKKCVKLNGKKRPTMKEVAASIENIIRFMQMMDNANKDVKCP